MSERGGIVTREQAIKELTELLPEEFLMEYSEAFKMAIKTLEQQPCDDCISREAAIRLAEQGQIQGFEWQFKELNKLPSVTPQQKIGQWVRHDTGHSIYYDCSRCGCAAPCTEFCDCFMWKLSAYCPDCGAKMVETQESEEEE